MPESVFALILYSKIQDQESFEIYTDNLHSLFDHLSQPELISRVYFVDDSNKEFQDNLRDTLSKLIAKTSPKAELIDVINNGSIYNAVNRVWAKVNEEYAISFNSDLRLIQNLPLAVVKKAFKKYPDVYLMHLSVCGKWGYGDSRIKQELKKAYPHFRVFQDNEMTTWFCFNENGKVFSTPQKFYLMQKQKNRILPQCDWGNELVPRVVDKENTLWVTKWPSKILEICRLGTQNFIGNPSIFRIKIIKKYLPLPKRYLDEDPAQCQETYFHKTSINCKYYISYLNLQAFAIQYKDFHRPCSDIKKEYWQAFLERNSLPITHKKIGFSNVHSKPPKGIKLFLLRRYCCLRTFLKWQLENLAIFILGKPRARRFWFFLKKLITT